MKVFVTFSGDSVWVQFPPGSPDMHVDLSHEIGPSDSFMGKTHDEWKKLGEGEKEVDDNA